MGLRFRKRVKICKGVGINFSKSGASLSLGGRGNSMNFGKRGVMSTLGIPGTGISYRSNLSSHHRSGSRSSGKRSASGMALPSQIQISMDPNGRVELRDKKGALITDQSVIRRIKATDAYRSMINDLEAQRQVKLEEIFNEAKEENDKFINIYKLAPQVDGEEQYIQILNSLTPPIYTRKQYDVLCPTEEFVRAQLVQEAKVSVKGNLLTVGKARKEYVERNLQERLKIAINQWTKEKEAFDISEAEKEPQENARYMAEFNKNKKYMIDLIRGGDDAVSDAVESWISSCELPVEINVDYEWYPNTNLMYLDVDLPEIEDLPEEEVVRLASGNLKEKKKTQTKIKQEYVTLVFGLAVFISANVFNSSPAIHGIVISGYTQRRNKIGDIVDEYVYSIKFTRDVFEKSNINDENPKDFCMKFENRCNITSSSIMKSIEPYSI